MTRRHIAKTPLVAICLIGATAIISAAYAVAEDQPAQVTQTSGIDPSKAAIMRSYQADVASQIANAPSSPKPTDSAALQPSPDCDASDWDSGVQYARETMLSKGIIDATSSYNVTEGNEHLIAYFGAGAGNPSVGLVAVLRLTLCGRAISTDTYQVPGAGRLSAVSGVGNAVQVKSAFGSLLSVNIDSGAVTTG